MTNDTTNPKTVKRQLRRMAQVVFEDRVYRIASLSTVAAGLLACLASVGVGISLVLTGAMIFVEL